MLNINIYKYYIILYTRLQYFSRFLHQKFTKSFNFGWEFQNERWKIKASKFEREIGDLSVGYEGLCPLPPQAFEKAWPKLLAHGYAEASRHFGRVTPRRFPSARCVKFGKKASFLRRIFRYARDFSSRTREENKMTATSMDLFLGTNLVPNGKLHSATKVLGGVGDSSQEAPTSFSPICGQRWWPSDRPSRCW